ncbi:calmodulin [Amborella trichopoda]|uniref:EF-hand domain-containing protein n=1 Tax=Amborella trichopoda TaxID=13333 RepID=W1P0E2_AMBTC|nr:calmodulin [Amborella trichopoda]ERN03297.1 hypothetical protein AMTR_s00003p00224450 [Amborella trichopoda]|eukprot:XP_006841622.1 calmodulin [Amborella trichopoda]
MCPNDRYAHDLAGLSDFRRAFTVLDFDCDGKIGKEDLHAFFQQFSADPRATEDVDSMIVVADRDKDGFVEYEEFEKVLSFPAPESPENEVFREVFRLMDGDGDGKLGFSDLKGYMGSLGFSLSDEDLEMMLRVGGGDLNEGVGYEGLVKILAVDLAR